MSPQARRSAAELSPPALSTPDRFGLSLSLVEALRLDGSEVARQLSVMLEPQLAAPETPRIGRGIGRAARRLAASPCGECVRAPSRRPSMRARSRSWGLVRRLASLAAGLQRVLAETACEGRVQACAAAR